MLPLGSYSSVPADTHGVSLSHLVFGDWPTQTAFVLVPTVPSGHGSVLMPTWGQGNCSAAPGSGPHASWRCRALFYDHAASVLLPPWNAEQESFCSLFPKYLWGSASEKALYFLPSQALLIALFEWEITSQVTNKENNKAPSGEYSGGSGLSGVRLLHFYFALGLDHMQVHLYTAVVTSLIRMCHWPQGGESGTNLLALLTTLHCHIKCVQYNCITVIEGIRNVLFI